MVSWGEKDSWVCASISASAAMIASALASILAACLGTTAAAAASLSVNLPMIRYILILSDSAGQAHEKLSDVRRELEGNDALALRYPDSTGIGPVWRTDKIELRNGVVIQAIGRKGRIRGRRNREARPSLILFDDVENNQTITSETERASTWRWATREVIPAGTAGTNFLSVGSALHRECVAVRLGQLAGWKGQTHRAIHHWPERMDLWEEWERLATNLADEHRGETAEAYYAVNREEMERGAEVYWQARWSILDLMKRRAEMGQAAFETEYQGVPSTEGLTEFPSACFDWAGFWFDRFPLPHQICLKVIALDPSKGDHDKGSDYQARVDVALDTTGTFWVDAEAHHELPTYMIRRTLKRAIEWGPVNAIVMESNATMGLMEPEVERCVNELRADMPGKALVLPWECLPSTDSKTLRIRSMGTYLARRQIRVRSTAGGRLLVDQLRDFPLQGTKDDLPDALALAVDRIQRLCAGG